MSAKAPKGETLKGHIGPGPWDGAKLGDLVFRAIRQATDRERADKVLTEALRRAGTSRVPQSAASFGAFVLGPLHDTLQDQTDEAATERVISILRPIIKTRSELELGPMAEGDEPTVLVVDDDIVVRAQLLSMLGAAGYRAVSAPDSNVALAMSVRCRPDVIISAMGIGRVRGGHLAALLSVAFRDLAPPLVLLRSGDEDTLVPGVIVLDKPVERTTLLQAVDLCLRRSSPKII